MKNYFFFLLLITFLHQTEAQVNVTFELKIPQNNDSLTTCFLAGNFNDWKPNDSNYVFSKNKEGKFYLIKQLPINNYEFKVTKGDWLKVETDIKGMAIANRLLKLKNDTSLKVEVLNWVDEFKQSPANHTFSTHVKILDSNFSTPQLNTKRRIWIYLPPSYFSSSKKYPVLYYAGWTKFI